MKTVEQIAAEIVAREGGYVNDPDDPGGATNYGVTLDTLKGLGEDRNGDGKVDLADLKSLSRADAQRIFVEHYFRKPRLGELPQPLQATVFDMQVNAGANAIRILQRLLTRMGFETADDGMVGPRTIEAARLADIAARAYLADAYGIARRNYYYALADARPASRKFARSQSGGKGGWITRSEEFISARYHLTLAEHRARVAKWA
jgi:lysozyme family protein